MSAAFDVAGWVTGLVHLDQVGGGVWRTRLALPGGPAVTLPPHANPALAQQEAAQLRVFLDAVVREAAARGT